MELQGKKRNNVYIFKKNPRQNFGTNSLKQRGKLTKGWIVFDMTCVCAAYARGD